MDQKQITQKFKEVSDEVEKMAAQQEQGTKNKVSAIRDDAAKKFSSVITSK
jgi:hypothetical protein